MTVNSTFTATCTAESAVEPTDVTISYFSNYAGTNCSDVLSEDFNETICNLDFTLEKSDKSVDGKLYIYEYTIESINVTDAGNYSCNITVAGEERAFPTTTIDIFGFNITATKGLVLVHGTENTMTCQAEHPALTETATVKVTWYKGLDMVESKSYGWEDEIAFELKLEGSWGDSASYRCLFEYANPYIPPIFSQKLDVAYVGIYRSSMYRFSTTSNDAENKLYLPKLAATDLTVYCYVQTALQASITGAAWTTIDGDATFTDKLTGKDNSPFETASRFYAKVNVTTTAEAADSLVQCEYSFNDDDQTTQKARIAIKTVASTEAYTKTWPSDYMMSFNDYAAFITATAVVWNTELASTMSFNFDEIFKQGGLLSETPETIYSDWQKGMCHNLFELC